MAENSGLSNNHLGNNPEKEALTRQWLEYAVLNVNYADNLPNSKRILKVSIFDKYRYFVILYPIFYGTIFNCFVYLHSKKELNEALKVNTYFAGTELTIADVVLYYLLHGIVVSDNYNIVQNENEIE